MNYECIRHGGVWNIFKSLPKTKNQKPEEKKGRLNDWLQPTAILIKYKANSDLDFGCAAKIYRNAD